MAKPVTDPETPGAPAPGEVAAADQAAASAEGAPPVEPTTDSPTPPEPASEPAPPSDPSAIHTYRVNWPFIGFQDKDWNAGDTVQCTEDEAAPYLDNAHILGVLTLEA